MYTIISYLQECNEFLAGHALRSQSRYSALSETAVMGVVCRHEVPFMLHKFISWRKVRTYYIAYHYNCLLFKGYLTACTSLNN